LYDADETHNAHPDKGKGKLLDLEDDEEAA